MAVGNSGERVLPPPFWTAQTRWILVTLVAIALSLGSVGLGRSEWVNWGGFPQFWRFFAAAAHPHLSGDFLQLTVRATLTTLAYAVCGTTLSVGLGLVGGILSAEVWWQALFPRRQLPLWYGMRLVLAVPRAIHELIWGLLFVNILGLDPLVAILGIAVPYGAIVAKVFSELLDETPRQPLQALLNSGATPLTAFLYTLLPQAFLDLLSYTFYRFECSIRSAAVLGIIGAGGLGYEIMLSLQSLRYEQLWTLFYALFVLNGSVDLGSALLRQRLGSPSRLDLNVKASRVAGAVETHAAVRAAPRSDDSSPSLQSLLWHYLPTLALVLAIGLIPFSVWYVGADYGKLWSPRTTLLLTQVAQAAWPLQPTLANLQQLGGLALQTLAMSILAIALAGLGGVVLSFAAAHTLFLPGGLLSGSHPTRWGRAIAWASLLGTRVLLLVCRAIPAPIWALVALFVLFPGMVPGAIALGVHNLGILGRLMAEVTENLDQRPILALKAQGAPAVLVFLYGILPLTLTRFLAYILYRWEVCTRETVIVGLVGAGGLGRLLTEQLSSFDYQGVLLSLIGFIGLTIGVDWVSGAARRSLR